MSDIAWFQARRDPASVFADWHDAVRRNKICHTILGKPFPEAMIRRRIELDMVRAVYDVDGMMTELTAAAEDWTPFYAARDRGIALAAEKMLVPDKCAFMWSEANVSEEKERLWSERIVAVDAAGMKDRDTGELHTGWIAEVFESDIMMETKRPAYYGPDRHRWTARRALLFPTFWSVETDEDKYGDLRTLDLTETDQFVYLLQFEQVLACCGLLATEPTLVDAPDNASFRSMNVGRGRGRLAPVPSIRRVLNINRVLYQHRPTGEPTGREMPLHYRRPTFRTYRHSRYINMQGKQGPVKSAIVRADKDDFAPVPVYQVES